ncbi:MAG: NAD-dependent epimerase/dehydratase family protein [candidate division Zixibacteria bacterium]|nr:NAD-dependent epimerase/dehydratase family protein [candidate division Zixibacteria bacterium]
MEKKTAFITGVTGFVGSHVARAFIKEGHHVRGLARATSDRSRVDDLDIEWFVGDLDAHETLREACHDVDWVIHIAGRIKAPSLETYRHANVVGTVNLLRAVQDAAPDVERFVYVSSLAAGGPARDGTARTELDPDAPLTPYGISKREGELAAMSFADRFPVCALRPPAVYGPGDTEVFQFFKTVRWHIKPRFGGRSMRSSIVHVGDLTDAIMLATTMPGAVGESFYIAEDRAYSLEEMEEMIQKALGTWAVNVRFPKPVLMGIATVAEWAGSIGGFTPRLNRHKAQDFLQNDWTCSVEKAKRQLGYQPRIPFDRGVKQTVEWYRAMDWL